MINKEMREDRQSQRTQSTFGNTQSIFSENRNANFLNQELMFLIENLHQKATESGLREDALIPQKSKKEKQIYKLATRPQSAAVTKKREMSPTRSVLQSSFYGGMSMLEPEEVDEDRFRQLESEMS